jgi:hypothetical protein
MDQPPHNFKCKSCPWIFTYDIKVCEALEHLLDSNLSMLLRRTATQEDRSGGPLLRKLVSNESHSVLGEHLKDVTGAKSFIRKIFILELIFRMVGFGSVASTCTSC